MIDKILAALSAATLWMPTQVLADKVGARSASNVNLHLKTLEKNGSVVSRSRFEAGTKVIEWRHADKPDVGDFVPAGRGKKAAPVGEDGLPNQMPTDKECCNAAKIIATTAGAEVSALHQRIADLEDDVRRQSARATVAEKTVQDWIALAGENECKSIPELRVFINAAIEKLDHIRLVKKANPKRPRLPFSITGLTGYHAGNDRVTLFLDRRLSARSVTLPAGKLAQLAEMAGG